MTRTPIARCFASLPDMAAPSGEAPPAAPDWIELIPVGDVVTNDGRRWRLADAARVIAATRQRAAGGIIPVDYDHGSEDPAASSRAAGWIEALEVRGGSIWGRVAWTPEGGRAVAAREYRFISPAFAYSKDDRVLHLTSAALTNQPALPQLRAVAHQQEETGMDPIIEALGLDPGSDEEAVLARIATLMSTATAVAPVLQAAGLDGDLDPAKATAICARLASPDAPDPARFVDRAAVDALAAEIAQLRTQQAGRDAEEAIAAARAEGKLPPALNAWAQTYAAKDIEGFRAWCAAQPAIVAPGRLAPGAAAPAKGVLTDAERAICRATGITEDAYLKTRDGGAA